MSPSKKTLFLSYFTVGYNIIEGLISIGIGILTESISLVGFGLDSFIESFSGGILIWRFTKHGEISNSHDNKVEQKAIRLIAYTFFILGIYVAFESVQRLYNREPPESNILGVIVAVISIAVMTYLYKKKKQVGLGNHIRSLVADSKQTLACIYMSITMLIGLGLNYFFHIWWSDAVAGIIIAGLLFKEGYQTYKEKKLCNC